MFAKRFFLSSFSCNFDDQYWIQVFTDLLWYANVRIHTPSEKTANWLLLGAETSLPHMNRRFSRLFHTRRNAAMMTSLSALQRDTELWRCYTAVTCSDCVPTELDLLPICFMSAKEGWVQEGPFTLLHGMTHTRTPSSFDLKTLATIGYYSK